MFSKYLKPNNKPPGELGTWVRCQRLAGLAVVAVALAVELVVELVEAVALALVVGMVALGRLVVGVVAKTLQNRHCFDNVERVQDPFDAVATVRRDHFHCLCQRLESVEAVVLRVNHFHCRRCASSHLRRVLLRERLSTRPPTAGGS